jgi:hypothetical protein
MARDYAAEYRRRIERAKAKATAKGESFDLAKARGHISKQVERQRARAQNSNRWTQGTLQRLFDKMLVRDETRMDRLQEAENEGLSVSQVTELIDLQNEVFLAYHRGDDIKQVRAASVACQMLVEDFGLDELGWNRYH